MPERNKQLAMIHIAKKDLDMDDSIYRDILWTQARVRSAKDLDDFGRDAVLQYFRQIGWKAKPSKPDQQRKPSRAPGQARHKNAATNKQISFIEYLWGALARADVVASDSGYALRAWIRRQTQNNPKYGSSGCSALEFLTKADASKAIESLKDWADRNEVEV